MRVSIYVDRARLVAKHPKPIVIDNRKGLVPYHSEVRIDGPSTFRYDPVNKDGSCVWVEALSDDVYVNHGEY
jgi:hypothetical protein